MKEVARNNARDYLAMIGGKKQQHATHGYCLVVFYTLSDY